MPFELGKIIGLKVVAIKGVKGDPTPHYILFDDEKTYVYLDDEKTYVYLDEQDFYTYHDCSSSARTIHVDEDEKFWKHMIESKDQDVAVVRKRPGGPREVIEHQEAYFPDATKDII
jgi:hypothetical protein